MEQKYKSARQSSKVIIISLLLFLMFPFYHSAAEPPLKPHPLAAIYKDTEKMLYLEDGRIVYSQFGEDSQTRSIEKIGCVDVNGTLMWEFVPPAQTMAMTQLIQTESGLFAFLGRRQGDNAPYVALITQEGQCQQEIILPMASDSRTLTPNGIVFISGLEAPTGRKLCKMLWDGTLFELELPDITGSNIVAESTHSGKTYIDAILINPQGQWLSTMLCVDENWQVSWQYEPGDYVNTSVEKWTHNELGGITLIKKILHDSDKSTQHAALEVVCLDANGKTVWTNNLLSHFTSPMIAVMRQNAEGQYTIWGRGDDTTVFMLILDREGLHMQSEYALSALGDCYQYVNEDVYVVSHDSTWNPGGFSPFTALERKAGKPFVVEPK